MKHYIAMAGLHGCLPSYCEVFESQEDAISALTDLLELGSTREKRLRANGYLELIPSPIESRQYIEFGAAYCEIVSCKCDTPVIHSDFGEDFCRTFTGQTQ